MTKKSAIRLLLLGTLIGVFGFANGSRAARPARAKGDRQAHATTMVYVTNSGGDNVTVIDLHARKAVDNIVVGAEVHGACGPAAGRTVFFTIMSTRTMKIVDTATNKVVATLPLRSHPAGARPNQCASTPDGHYVAVPMRFYGKEQSKLGDVDVIDPKKRTIVKILPLRFPHNCFAAGSNDFLFCENRADGRIYRLNLKTMRFDQSFPIGRDPRPFAIATRTEKIYSALGGFHGFSVVDMKNNAVRRVSLPDVGPEPPVCQKYEPNTPTHGVALTPDGKQLWVTSMANASVYVYDIATGTFSKPIRTGACPNWISITANGDYVTVSNCGQNTTSIIDAKTQKVLANIQVGDVPKRLLAMNVPAA